MKSGERSRGNLPTTSKCKGERVFGCSGGGKGKLPQRGTRRGGGEIVFMISFFGHDDG